MQRDLSNLLLTTLNDSAVVVTIIIYGFSCNIFTKDLCLCKNNLQRNYDTTETRKITWI